MISVTLTNPPASQNTDMGRRRQSDLDLPPRMHLKAGTYWYVTSTAPRKWIKLGPDLPRARLKWAVIENGGDEGDNPLFCSLMDAWAASPAFEGLAPTSRAIYTSSIKRLRTFFAGARVRDIRPQHIALWLDKHPSRHQANIGRAVISNVMAVACRRGLVERNPAKEIPPLRVRGRDRYITDAEFFAIRSAACEVVRCAIDLSYLTGARISDVLKMKLADVQAEGLYIAQQKTGKRQRFELSPGLADAIACAKALPRPVRGLHLICDGSGKPYKHPAFYSMWLQACAAAGVEDVHFHDLRAKAATDAKRLGMDYQAILGHTTQAMSDKYVRTRETETVMPLPKIKESK